jgi:DNA polymerase-1
MPRKSKHHPTQQSFAGFEPTDLRADGSNEREGAEPDGNQIADQSSGGDKNASPAGANPPKIESASQASPSNGGVSGPDSAAAVDGKQATATKPPANTTANTSTNTTANVVREPLSVVVRAGVPDLRGKRVLVVDSHSLIYQVFHALPPMTSPGGLPVAAVHGFMGDMLELLVRKSPDYLFCAFDKSETTFRNELYAEYKAHREGMPEDLRQQIPLIRQTLDAMAIGQLECGGYEADDILAKVAAETEAAGGECLIVTSDKDCRQLITNKVRLYNIRKNFEMGPEELMQDWGIRPDQVVDYQAMVGDPVDNVPGIPLVGPKLAKQLLEQFDTLEGVFENTASISGPKRRQNVENGRQRALLSRDLVRLRTDFDCPVPWEAGRVGQANLSQIETLCDQFGFRRIKDRATELFRIGGSHAKQASAEIDVSEYQCVADPRALATLCQLLAKKDLICIDTETTDTNPRRSQLVGISLCWEEGKAAYIPVRAPDGDPTIDQATAIELLRPILEDSAIGKIGQNIKFDAIVLRGCGIRLRGIVHDTMVADYILEPGQRNHTMDDMAKRYLNHTTISIKQLIGTGKNQTTMDKVPVAQVAPYAAEDADVPFRIAPMLRERLQSEGLAELFDTIEMPLIDVLAEMEFNGIRVDVDRLSELSRGFTIEIERLREEIHALAEEEFNIDSPKQLAVVLFEKLGLPVVKKTKTGASTDADVLQQLAPLHPLPEKVVAYRQATKLKNTYVDALPQLVCQQTGRIHTSFRQDVAATGRLSSTEPNLQNIPIRSEQGRAIRSAFTAGNSDWLLMGADYSQIELRVLAHYSGDDALIEAYAEDADIHRRVAAEVHGVTESSVTDDMRRMAKTINFGIVYGQSPFGLARTLGISKDEAANFIELYFARYPGVQAFMLETLANCRRMGHVETMLGRRRRVQGIRDFQKLDVSKMRSMTEAERIAVNTVIQGSAADLIKMAMLSVYKQMQAADLQANLLLQIHDELLFEVAPESADQLESMVRSAMIGVARLKVPLKVDVARGATWAEV